MLYRHSDKCWLDHEPSPTQHVVGMPSPDERHCLEYTLPFKTYAPWYLLEIHTHGLITIYGCDGCTRSYIPGRSDRVHVRREGVFLFSLPVPEFCRSWTCKAFEEDAYGDHWEWNEISMLEDVADLHGTITKRENDLPPSLDAHSSPDRSSPIDTQPSPVDLRRYAPSEATLTRLADWMGKRRETPGATRLDVAGAPSPTASKTHKRVRSESDVQPAVLDGRAAEALRRWHWRHCYDYFGVLRRRNQPFNVAFMFNIFSSRDQKAVETSLKAGNMTNAIHRVLEVLCARKQSEDLKAVAVFYVNSVEWGRNLAACIGRELRERVGPEELLPPPPQTDCINTFSASFPLVIRGTLRSCRVVAIPGLLRGTALTQWQELVSVQDLAVIDQFATGRLSREGAAQRLHAHWTDIPRVYQLVSVFACIQADEALERVRQSKLAGQITRHTARYLRYCSGMNRLKVDIISKFAQMDEDERLQHAISEAHERRLRADMAALVRAGAPREAVCRAMQAIREEPEHRREVTMQVERARGLLVRGVYDVMRLIDVQYVTGRWRRGELSTQEYAVARQLVVDLDRRRRESSHGRVVMTGRDLVGSIPMLDDEPYEPARSGRIREIGHWVRTIPGRTLFRPLLSGITSMDDGVVGLRSRAYEPMPLERRTRDDIALPLALAYLAAESPAEAGPRLAEDSRRLTPLVQRVVRKYAEARLQQELERERATRFDRFGGIRIVFRNTPTGVNSGASSGSNVSSNGTREATINQMLGRAETFHLGVHAAIEALMAKRPGDAPLLLACVPPTMLADFAEAIDRTFREHSEGPVPDKRTRLLCLGGCYRLFKAVSWAESAEKDEGLRLFLQVEEYELREHLQMMTLFERARVHRDVLVTAAALLPQQPSVGTLTRVFGAVAEGAREAEVFDLIRNVCDSVPLPQKAAGAPPPRKGKNARKRHGQEDVVRKALGGLETFLHTMVGARVAKHLDEPPTVPSLRCRLARINCSKIARQLQGLRLQGILDDAQLRRYEHRASSAFATYVVEHGAVLQACRVHLRACPELSSLLPYRSFADAMLGLARDVDSAHGCNLSAEVQWLFRADP